MKPRSSSALIRVNSDALRDTPNIKSFASSPSSPWVSVPTRSSSQWKVSSIKTPAAPSTELVGAALDWNSASERYIVCVELAYAPKAPLVLAAERIWIDGNWLKSPTDHCDRTVCNSDVLALFPKTWTNRSGLEAACWSLSLTMPKTSGIWFAKIEASPPQPKPKVGSVFWLLDINDIHSNDLPTIFD